MNLILISLPSSVIDLFLLAFTRIDVECQILTLPHSSIRIIDLSLISLWMLKLAYSIILVTLVANIEVTTNDSNSIFLEALASLGQGMSLSQSPSHGRFSQIF